VQTPDFNHSSSITSLLPTAAAKTPLLAPVSFVPSRCLWRLKLAAYGLFALSFCGALWPFLNDHPALIVLLFMTAVWLGYLLKRAGQQRLAGTLCYSESGWVLHAGVDKSLNHLQHQARCLQLKGDVLIWPGLVILPFVEIKTQRSLSVIIAVDSVGAADFARLRSWLRRRLVPKV